MHMKTSPEKFAAVDMLFPRLQSTLAKLEAADIPYIIGGSVALYVQGNERQPHDVDIMFTDEAHTAADELFHIASEYIERPNVAMRKSSPVSDGSIDFLSGYTVIADGVSYHHPPLQKVQLEFGGKLIYFIPAEKITAIKLIGRRNHHQDIEDVVSLTQHVDFDNKLFWEMVELLDAAKAVEKLLKTHNLRVKKPFN